MKHQHDLALVYLAIDIVHDGFHPLCIAEEIVPTSYGVLNSFGRDEVGFSGKLNTILLNVPTNDECRKSNQALAARVDDSSHFCAGNLDGTSACSGDSGAGLVFEGNNNNGYRLKGILSSALSNANNECDTLNYAIFIEIARYLSWLPPKLSTYNYTDLQETNELTRNQTAFSRSSLQAVPQKIEKFEGFNSHCSLVEVSDISSISWTTYGVLISESQLLLSTSPENLRPESTIIASKADGCTRDCFLANVINGNRTGRVEWQLYVFQLDRPVKSSCHKQSLASCQESNNNESAIQVNYRSDEYQKSKDSSSESRAKNVVINIY